MSEEERRVYEHMTCVWCGADTHSSLTSESNVLLLESAKDLRQYGMYVGIIACEDYQNCQHRYAPTISAIVHWWVSRLRIFFSNTIEGLNERDVVDVIVHGHVLVLLLSNGSVCRTAFNPLPENDIIEQKQQQTEYGVNNITIILFAIADTFKITSTPTQPYTYSLIHTQSAEACCYRATHTVLRQIM